MTAIREVAAPVAEHTTDAWREANYRYVMTEIERIRLLLERRVEAWRHTGSSAAAGTADRELAERRASSLRSALMAVDAELEAQTASFMSAGRPPAIEGCVYLFGLNRFQRDLLLLCLAAELTPSLESLFAAAQNDANRRFPTLSLALGLFTSTPEAELAAYASVMPGSALRRFRLITLGAAGATVGPLSTWALQLEERVAGVLLGLPWPDERVGELIQLVPKVPTSTDHDVLAERIRGWIQADGPGPWPVVQLTGQASDGRVAVAHQLCAGLGLRLHRLDLARLLALGERAAALEGLEREAILSRMAFYLEAEEPLTREAAAVLDEVVDRVRALLVVGARERRTCARPTIAVELPNPNAADRVRLWRQALAGLPHCFDAAVERLIEQLDLGPEAIARAVATAESLARRRDGTDPRITAEELREACQRQIRQQLDGLVTCVAPCHTWDDLVLPGDLLEHLHEIGQQVVNRVTVYEDWGFGEKLNRGRGVTALFAGPSGTGKTLAAEILAHELGLSLFRIDLSMVVNKYIGETEKNLRRVFDAAEQGGAILFFDEADAIFGKRSEVKASHDRYANLEISYLLQRMEDYSGLAILATNLKSHLDESFLRRLRFLVDFPFPDARLREAIWRRMFPPRTISRGLDFAALARMEITGGNIRTIAVNAAFLAAAAGVPVGTEHVMRAARREYRKLDKLIVPSEIGPDTAERT